MNPDQLDGHSVFPGELGAPPSPRPGLLCHGWYALNRRLSVLPSTIHRYVTWLRMDRMGSGGLPPTGYTVNTRRLPEHLPAPPSCCKEYLASGSSLHSPQVPAITQALPSTALHVLGPAPGVTV